MSKVLLVGGMGFIGRRLAHACVTSDMSVRIADVWVGNAEEFVGLPGVEIVQADYREATDRDRILHGIDVVVHLAHDVVRLVVGSSIAEEIERNVLPSVRLMDDCLNRGIDKLVFVSSGGTIYGDNPQRTPIPEDASTDPISMYGTVKLMLERVVRLYYMQKEFPAVIARPANAYGPGQRPFTGQGLIATVLASAIEGRTVTVFGDGSIVRDYIHVDDIARGLVDLMRNGDPGEAYNIGTGIGTSIREVITHYIEPMVAAEGYRLDVVYEAERGVDVQCNMLAYKKIRDMSGFVPRVTLAEGLAETWRWIKDYVRQGGT